MGKIALPMSLAVSTARGKETLSFAADTNRVTSMFSVKNTNHISSFAANDKKVTSSFTMASSPSKFQDLNGGTGWFGDWWSDSNLSSSSWTNQVSGQPDLDVANSTITSSDSAMGNRKTANFSATNNNLILHSAIALGAFTVIFVGNTSSSAGYFWSHVTDGSNRVWLYNTTSYSQWHRTTGHADSIIDQTSANWATNSTPKVYIHVFDGNSSGHLVYINGTVQTNVDIGFSGNPGTSTISAATQFLGGVAATTGRVGAIGLCGAVLSSGDIATATDRARAFFNI